MEHNLPKVLAIRAINGVHFRGVGKNAGRLSRIRGVATGPGRGSFVCRRRIRLAFRRPCMPADLGATAICLLGCCAAHLAAQELQPRAYIPAPMGLNYFGISYSRNVGGVLFDASLPLEDVRATGNVTTFMFGQSFGVLGRSAQALVVLPYAKANLEGLVSGAQRDLYRSGLGDAVFRYAMNLHGAPAMHMKEFLSYRQKTIVGASITVAIPTGQYDLNRIINIGTNRWGFKPEVGVSHPLGRWVVEGAAGVWLYTANQQFNGSSVRKQVALGSLQAHVVRHLPHRSWVAVDWSFYTGGRSNVNRQDRPDYMGNARWGISYAISLRPRHAIKFSYFGGYVTRVGTDIRSVGISYNIVWRKGL